MAEGDGRCTGSEEEGDEEMTEAQAEQVLAKLCTSGRSAEHAAPPATPGQDGGRAKGSGALTEVDAAGDRGGEDGDRGEGGPGSAAAAPHAPMDVEQTHAAAGKEASAAGGAGELVAGSEARPAPAAPADGAGPASGGTLQPTDTTGPASGGGHVPSLPLGSPERKRERSEGLDETAGVSSVGKEQSPGTFAADGGAPAPAAQPAADPAHAAAAADDALVPDSRKRQKTASPPGAKNRSRGLTRTLSRWTLRALPTGCAWRLLLLSAVAASGSLPSGAIRAQECLRVSQLSVTTARIAIPLRHLPCPLLGRILAGCSPMEPLHVG